jgi:hypothetical protein
MRTLKLLAAVLVALALAVLGGWMWGARGTSAAQAALAESAVHQHAALVRIHLLQARVDLFQLNFGNTSRSLDAARADLVTLDGALAQRQNTAGLEAVKSATAMVADAQKQVSHLDQNAQVSLEQALGVLAVVWEPVPSKR